MEYEFKKKLKELRRENHLTQKQLAALLDKSRTGIANWEQGLAEPSLNDIRKLCKIFDVSADILLGLEE